MSETLPLAVLHQKMHERAQELRAELQGVDAKRKELVRLDALLKAWEDVHEPSRVTP